MAPYASEGFRAPPARLRTWGSTTFQSTESRRMAFFFTSEMASSRTFAAGAEMGTPANGSPVSSRTPRAETLPSP